MAGAGRACRDRGRGARGIAIARRVHPHGRARLRRGAPRPPAPRARPSRRPAMSDNQPSVTLPNGEAMPAFGQGTWHMREDRRRAAAEEAALKLCIELGINLIDTAEVYGNCVAEEIVARATAGARERLFIVSKLLPYNA